MSSKNTGVYRHGSNAGMDLWGDEPVWPGQPSGEPLSGQAGQFRWIAWASRIFLSRRHIDWSQHAGVCPGQFRPDLFELEAGASHTAASSPADAEGFARRVEGRAHRRFPNPETGRAAGGARLRRVRSSIMVRTTGLSPDLTVVLTDWKYRTIGLHDFTTNKVITPSFGPTGDHRLEGIMIAAGPAFRRPRPSCARRPFWTWPPRSFTCSGIPVPERHGRPGTRRDSRLERSMQSLYPSYVSAGASLGRRLQSHLAVTPAAEQFETYSRRRQMRRFKQRLSRSGLPLKRSSKIWS